MKLCIQVEIQLPIHNAYKLDYCKPYFLFFKTDQKKGIGHEKGFKSIRAKEKKKNQCNFEKLFGLNNQAIVKKMKNNACQNLLLVSLNG